MPKNRTKQIAFLFDDMTEFYAMRELIDALKAKKIPTDIIVPQDSGYNGLATHTLQKLKKLGYNPLTEAPKNKIYKVLLSPYPTLKIVRRLKFVYHIRMPYSTISAKPNPTYGTEAKIDYDAIVCFNNYEPTFLNCYGAECYAVPYWKYYNFKKDARKSKKPTLLILPTFGQDTSCAQYLTKSIIDDIKKHFYIIIKSHHAIHFNQDGQNVTEKLEDLADEFYNSDMPITSLLKKADIVLSDNSGSIFESIYSDTPIVTFSKDLNARHLEGVDTLQYKLMKQGVLPHTSDPKKILPLLLGVKPYFKKQQEAKQKLFPEVKKDSVNVTVKLIEDYIARDETKDYKKILHDLMLKEWLEDKKISHDLINENAGLKSQNSTLETALKERDDILNSGAYRLYDKLITPYKKLKSLRSKK